MGWFEALLAGIIQGVTEFLPISSSGHLIIYSTLVGGEEGASLVFTVFLHFATLLAVIIMYRQDVWLLIKELIGALAGIFRGKPDFKTPERRYLLMVIIATIPAILAGGAVKVLELDAMLENIFIVAVMLIVTAVFMFLVDWIGKGRKATVNVVYNRALFVGIIQAIAILPGLSRSGSTIFAGVLSGFGKEFAVRFAFILSIPAILGASIVELHGAMKTGEMGAEPLGLALGFAAALLCGMLAIRIIRFLIRNNKFFVFGIYCLCASAFAFMVGFGVIHA